MSKSRGLPALVVCSVVAMLAIMVVTVISNRADLPPVVEINTDGQPTLGYKNAKVHVVVFEEPKCSHCRKFNDTVFPKIKEKYIDTNKILYTVIPVSFLPGSMPAAMALLCTFHQNKDFPNNELFFVYLDYMFRHQPTTASDWATVDKLQEMAKKASPAINLAKLKRCVEKEKWRIQIEKNTAYGNQVMGHLTTPSVYVNGMLASNLTSSEISRLINAALNQHGLAGISGKILQEIHYTPFAQDSYGTDVVIEGGE